MDNDDNNLENVNEGYLKEMDTNNLLFNEKIKKLINNLLLNNNDSKDKVKDSEEKRNNLNSNNHNIIINEINNSDSENDNELNNAQNNNPTSLYSSDFTNFINIFFSNLLINGNNLKIINKYYQELCIFGFCILFIYISVVIFGFIYMRNKYYKLLSNFKNIIFICFDIKYSLEFR